MPSPPPHAALTVDVKDAFTLPATLHTLACSLVGDAWGDAAGTLVQPVYGGITNSLFKVYRSDSPRAVLVRVFGDKTEIIIDRENDLAAFRALAALGFGPELVGTFDNGRVEGFLLCRPLDPAEMGSRSPIDFLPLVAKELARMHALPIAGDRVPRLWSCLRKWQAMAAEAAASETTSDSPRAAAKDAILAAQGIDGIAADLDWLSSILPSEGNGQGQRLLDAAALRFNEGQQGTESHASIVQPLLAAGALRLPPAADAVVQARLDAMALLSSVVYAHNDLLSGNVLQLKEGDMQHPSRVQIVDYEYADWNYLGFDVANHFCEYVGFDFTAEKFEAAYPSAETQRAWFNAYLTSAGANHALLHRPGAALDAFYDEIFKGIGRFALASHLWWGLWAALQAKYSPIDFDYAGYCENRLAAFRKFRELEKKSVDE